GARRGGPRLVVLAVLAQLALRAVLVDVVPVLRIGVQVLRGPLDLPAEVPLVGAALADLADHAAVGTAIGRAVTAAQDFLLVDGAVREGDAAEAAQRVGGVEAVEVVRVLGDRGAAERHHRAAQGVDEERAARDHAGRQQGDRLGAARQRQAGQLLGGDDGARIHAAHVDARQAVGRYRHGRQALDTV